MSQTTRNLCAILILNNCSYIVNTPSTVILANPDPLDMLYGYSEALTDFHIVCHSGAKGGTESVHSCVTFFLWSASLSKCISFFTVHLINQMDRNFFYNFCWNCLHSINSYHKLNVKMLQNSYIFKLREF